MATPDAHKNFAYSTLSNAPGTGGTTFNVQTGDGSKFPTPPFNATVWPTGGVQPTAANAEIIRVTAISTDSFTVTRTQEGSTNQNVTAGYQIAAAITAKTLTDIEGNYVNSWTPYVLQTGLNTATLNNNSGISSTGSVFVFPVTLQGPVKFNQILIPNSLSYVLSAITTNVSNSYYSNYGIYSLLSSTLLTLISSSSFSIGETLSLNSNTAASITWNYPTTTATSATGTLPYGGFPSAIDATGKISSYISGSRVVGLQFGGEMSLSGGQYWLGMMSMRSTAVSSVVGLSHAGIIGQVINPINGVGTGAAIMPLGIHPADWANKVTSNTAWYGRHIIGLVTATSIPNFLGTHLPDNITISQLGHTVTNSYTVLPAITFVST